MFKNKIIILRWTHYFQLGQCLDYIFFIHFGPYLMDTNKNFPGEHDFFFTGQLSEWLIEWLSLFIYLIIGFMWYLKKKMLSFETFHKTVLPCFHDQNPRLIYAF